MSAPGRPPVYRPEFGDIAIELGRQGKSRTYIAAALGVSRRTVYQWMEDHPEFSEAMDLAQTFCQQWWEDAGQQGMVGKAIDGGVWKYNMMARFPTDWHETTRVETTGKDGAPLAIEYKVNLADQIIQNIALLQQQKKE